ncbi:MAG: DUF4159 domain-containing protein [Xanthobacteraceae bacterium]|nr:DUF4159 domain-containing protein [Xanthobacteraceae bacterium]QYK44456.1 MAG: DUF4159 domain-containing protein [Xanthobacteraceae bacterium]
MIGLPVGFTAPYLLLALLALPLLWFLLRLVPPRPRRIHFPPTRLLLEIDPKEETPARTPWWLTALRLFLAALVIFAAAGPLLNPPPATTQSSGPIVLIVDSGWASAAQWQNRLYTANAIIARAEAENRPIALLATGRPLKNVSLLRPFEAREALKLLAPAPHSPKRGEVLPGLIELLARQPDASVIWLSDGIDSADSANFIATLNARVSADRLTVVTGGQRGPLALGNVDNSAGALTVKILRADNTAPERGVVRARDLRGLPLGDAPFAFEGDKLEAEAKFDLPVEIRNDIARLEISGERSAGAIQLLDKRWRRRTVGVVAGGTIDTSQPLLAPTYYLSRALGPFADVRLADGTGTSEAITRFIEQQLPVLVFSDVGTIPAEARDRLIRWIENGGVLIRFAGRRLAGATDDDLVPVKLRRGGRVLGGSLSWEQPQKLGTFSKDSPFADLAVPGDILVTRQVLAEPDGLLAERTWASLADGTPLVTAEKRGRGIIILFHVTADTAWSNLPLSGTFVEMLHRTVGLGSTANQAAPANANQPANPNVQTLAPSRLLDGFGVFTAPGPQVKPVPADFAGPADIDHPAGFYGPADGMLAVNTLNPGERIARLDLSQLKAKFEVYRRSEPVDLRAALLSGAFLLLLLDALVVLWMAGGINKLTRKRATAAIALFALLTLALASPAFAQPQNPKKDDPTQTFELRASLQTRLAYVITGDAETDMLSRAGLETLTTFLSTRTALEPGTPLGVDISRDELAFFPMLYWPIVPGAPKPSPETLARIDAYMKQGGTILFDTRDALAISSPRGDVSPAIQTLRDILSSLDIPELEPVPRDHVLTKSFYLLRDFPGRFTTGSMWVEALQPDDDDDGKRPARAGDGVSPLIITSNDLAGAWALGPDGQPMLPLTPGEPRQREFAFRTGVNIVMYVLTGNYKADQVHVPALLERLGQ